MNGAGADNRPVHVIARRIAAMEPRLNLEQAYCLTRLTFDHAGGPVVPDRDGPIALRVCNELAAHGMVEVGRGPGRTDSPDRRSALASLLEALHRWPEDAVANEPTRTTPRLNLDWLAQVTTPGLRLVSAAIWQAYPDSDPPGPDDAPPPR